MGNAQESKQAPVSVCDAYVGRLPIVTETLPSGMPVQFRRPGPLEWVAIWDNVPTLQSIEQKGLTDDQTLALWNKMRRTIMTFAVSPKLVDKDMLDCANDELSIRMLTTEDMVAFLNAIVDSIGVNSTTARAAGETLEPSKL